MDGFKDSTKMKYMMGGDVSAYKSGGTVKKAMGGAMKSVDKDKNPGLSKLPTDVRNKMGYMKKGGVMKKGNGGGVFNEKGKRATMAEIAAEDRRMAGRPVEGVSTRPTDSSGRRASDADLGRPAVKKVVKKAMGGGVPSYSDKPMIRRKTGGLSVMPKGKC